MPYLSEIIVSLDGPTAEVHNRIRGSQAFEQIIKGIERVVSSTLRPNVAIRTVVQRMNFRMLDKMVELAKSLRIDRISFIAADVLSDSFHRAGPGAASDRERIILTEEDVVEFRNLMKGFVKKNRVEIRHRFISEDQDRLFHIVQYFEALVGKAGFPRNVCNAPMVSTVITSTGDLLPCFFLPSFGNLRSASIHQLLNNNHIRSTRRQVKAYSLQRCQECVCTLKIHPLAAAFDRF